MRPRDQRAIGLIACVCVCAYACDVEHPSVGDERPPAHSRPTLTPPPDPPPRPTPLCDGTPTPTCDGPFTGASCNLPCLTGTTQTATCGIDRYCHSDGTTYGLATRNAVLFPLASDDSEQTVHAAFEAWIHDHPADLGLAAGISPDDLDLQPLPHARSTAGPFTLHRFAQRIHGVPVLAPDGIVTLVQGPQGAIAITGAILDGRTPYDHTDVHATAARAERSMLAHARAHPGVPAKAKLEIVHAAPMAMPTRRSIAWAGFVRRAGGGSLLARIIVDADPRAEGPVLPLWSLRPLGAAGLPDTQPIDVHALDLATHPATPGHADQSALTTGAPLLGSIDDATLDVQLATDRVVVLDMNGELEDELETHATRVLDEDGIFDATTGAQLSAQVAYHLFQSGYDYIDEHLTDPLVGAKRWDSANWHYTNGGLPSDTPPGTFSPRVLALANASSEDCPVQGAACAMASGYAAGAGATLEFPELAHHPPLASNEEVTGSIFLPGEGVEPVVFIHELGHIIDLFTGGGITQDFLPECGGPCPLECVEDTTDEAPPLTESIAQLLAFVFLHQQFESIDPDHCGIVDLVSVNGSKPWTPGACIPPDEDISLFQRPDACAKTSPYCDKPAEPGTRTQCCFDDEDLADCVVLLPDACPAGATGPAGGMGTGTARVVPTGSCDSSPGYHTNSLYQAFWQMLVGRRCEPTAPFECVSVEWAPGVSPLDATTAALLYAMRINALTYDQLVDGMATYVSCTYGTTAYEDFNAVACTHGLRDCDEPAPIICETCGNGVREGSETCDGTDWQRLGCEDLPEYSGGTLTCDQATCELDFTQCTMPGVDTTAGSSPLGGSSTSSSADTEAEAGSTDPGGCGCRTQGSTAPWLLLLSLLGARPRRRVE